MSIEDIAKKMVAKGKTDTKNNLSTKVKIGGHILTLLTKEQVEA